MSHIKKFHISIEHIIFSYVILVGILFTFFVPPFQKPDEVVHFYRTVALSRGQVVCQQHDGASSFTFPKYIYELPIRLSGDIKFDYNKKFPQNAFSQNDLQTDIREYVWKDWCGLSFIGYIPNVVGFIMGNITGNILVSFYLGRLTGFLFFLISLWFARKYVSEHFKPIVYVTACIPMLLHQVSGFTYDEVQISMMVILFSLFTHFFETKIITKKLVAIFVSSLLILVLVKSGYYPLLGLLLLIPYKKIQGYSPKYLLVLFFTSLIAMIIGIRITSNYGQSAFSNFANPQIQSLLILTHPFYFIQAIINAIDKNADFWIQSFIGKFGWLDYQLNGFIYLLYICITGVILYKSTISKASVQLNKYQLGILFLSIFGTVLLIFTGMYLIATPVAEDIVQGVQGRYFIVLFPFFLFFLNQIYLKLKQKKLMPYVYVVCMLIFVFHISQAIYGRYFDYSKGISNPNVLDERLQSIRKEPNSLAVVSVSKTIRFQMPVDMDKKLAGFQVLTIGSSSAKVLVPYEFVLYNQSCTEQKANGFFKQSDLQVTGKYSQLFRPFRSDEPEVCVSISPFVEDNLKNYLLLGVYKKSILIEPLYLF
ncbi:MAG: DUF2142 domain-containing protein [Candidatus Roizmanbacteria bacterium]